jgi:ubiquinone/menaquinone biosynthesis C-methylase UbiE
MKDEEIKKMVRDRYGNIAEKKSSCCDPAASCCGGTSTSETTSRSIGYSEEELKAVPEASNMGLGCGNPTALASLKEGETVLDLGSGGGLDCFLAARQVGENGRVVGVDMTSEMLEKSRQNAREGGYKNVEFRLGEIENLPAADNTFDVVISNCVINLSPDKERVFQEAFRVLKPGGRLMVSDIVLNKELPDFIKESGDAYVGCIAGAIKKDDYIEQISAAGFEQVEVLDTTEFEIRYVLDDPAAQEILKTLSLSKEEAEDLEHIVVSIKVRGEKPSNKIA